MKKKRVSKKTNTAIKRPVMGAIPGAKGVTFRVWAPHAEKVYVTGNFNAWSKTSTPLVKEKNGNWSTDVSEAKTGDSRDAEVIFGRRKKKRVGRSERSLKLVN